MLDINELYITPDSKKMIIDVSVKDDEWHKDAYIESIIIDTQDTFIPDINQPSSEFLIERTIVQDDVVAKIAWESGRVDEYIELINSANYHVHKHNISETGKYCNPITITSYDLNAKTATTVINNETKTIPLIKGLYYKQTVNEVDEIYKFNGEEFIEFEYKPSKTQHIRVEINQSDICESFNDTMFYVWIKEAGVDPNAPCSENRENAPYSENRQYTLGVCINEFTVYRRFMCLIHELLKDCDVPKYFIDLHLRWQAVKMAIASGNYSKAILLWKRFFLFKHQKPLWENPQYIRFWKDWHKDELYPSNNYSHPVYGWGGSFFNQNGSHCRTCRR